MIQFNINSIYRAIEGEGIHVGTPQVFVRYQGCAIGCVNCDSKDTWSFETGRLQTLDEVMHEIYEQAGQGKNQIKRVSITGGDPLHPKHVPSVVELCKRLKAEGFYINIEAAGTRVVKQVFDLVDYISWDYKTPSTQVKSNPELSLMMIDLYPRKFQIKSVVDTKTDFDEVQSVYNELKNLRPDYTLEWCITPAYDSDKEFPQRSFQEVMIWNLDHGSAFRVIGQQHKWIYGSSQKNV